MSTGCQDGGPVAHPLAEKYPLMTDEEFAAFKANIARRKPGDRRPKVLLFEGKILDGRHRDRACRELGIEPEYEEFTGTAEEAAAEVDRLNLYRRHLTPEFRRQRVAELRLDGVSVRGIAEQLGVPRSTVARDLATVRVRTVDPDPPTVPRGTVEPPPAVEPAQVVGRNGKTYQATKPKPVPEAPEPVPTPRTQGQRAVADRAKLVEGLAHLRKAAALFAEVLGGPAGVHLGKATFEGEPLVRVVRRRRRDGGVREEYTLAPLDVVTQLVRDMMPRDHVCGGCGGKGCGQCRDSGAAPVAKKYWPSNDDRQLLITFADLDGDTEGDR